MRFKGPLTAGLVSACLLIAAPAFARAPVLVELFTSQGCANCGDANAYAAALATRDDVLPLIYSVDYWDYLGWRDTFAKPEFTNRQKAYVARLTKRPVYTPQMVVDGRTQASGVRQGLIERLIDEAKAFGKKPPAIRRPSPDRIRVSAGAVPKGGAEVWLIRYDPRAREVEIPKGENRGKTLAYRNVVRELHRLGSWSGKSKAYRLPAGDESLKEAVVLQQAGGGRVLALWTE